ncbi:MAG: hypothetical protein IPO32_06940 [Crocinitomicaceae bacterium]|nr:hypothetical protein [Crocinitomicaceae bacterium]
MHLLIAKIKMMQEELKLKVDKNGTDGFGTGAGQSGHQEVEDQDQATMRNWR